MLLSAEAAKTAQRADLENHLETTQHALQDKQQVQAQLYILLYFIFLFFFSVTEPGEKRNIYLNPGLQTVQQNSSIWLSLSPFSRFTEYVTILCVQELSKAKAQLEELGRRLQEKQEHCSQLEATLKENRDQLLAAEQKTDMLENQAKVSNTYLTSHTFPFCLVMSHPPCCQPSPGPLGLRIPLLLSILYYLLHDFVCSS